MKSQYLVIVNDNDYVLGYQALRNILHLDILPDDGEMYDSFMGRVVWRKAP